MRKRIPLSFALFALTGVIFLLQAFPYTGIFLMLVLAMFWSVVTLNAAFLAVVLDVYLGRLGRFWLILPLLWFGGYLIAAAASHLEAARLGQRIADNNAGKRLSFSPVRESLVIEVRDYSSSGIAEELVRSYALPVAFEKDLNGKNASFRSRRIGGPDVCQRLRADPLLREAGVFSVGFYEDGEVGRRSLVKGLCAYYAPETPTLPAVTVAIDKEQKPQSLAAYVLRQIVITPPEGQTLNLLAGYAAPLQWFPALAMGCGLNDASPSWDCDASFMRETRRAVGADGKFGVVPVIVDALELSKSPASERRAAIAAQPSAPFDAISAGRVEKSLANLDAVLEGRPHKLNYHDFKGLEQRPDLLVPRADAMIAALNAAFDAGPGRREDGYNLQRLITALPAEDYARIGPGLLKVYESHPDFDPHMLHPNYLPRLGDLGVIALPLLERLAKQPKDRVAPRATLAICRIGTPAAGAADALAQEVMSNKLILAEWYQAVYVTERRLGRPDLADKVRDDWLEKNPKRRWDTLWADVSAESPADVCLDRGDMGNRRMRLEQAKRKADPR